MDHRNRLPLIIAVLLILVSLVSLAVAQDDPIIVDTFRSEFINWATAHVDEFTFPEQQLYSEVLCNMTIACPSAPADCDPWDRFGNLKVRHWLDAENYEDYEIARFITPYDITFSGGPGTCSWTIDVTDYQFLLHDQVTLVLYIESWMGNDNGWLMTVRFNMQPGAPEREPFAISRLWSLGHLVYGDPDNPAADHLPPVQVTVPEMTTWAKMRTFSTGHGFWNTDNAAEFSYKWQRVLVDAFQDQHYLWRPDCEYNRCSPQQGTWEYDRAGWCPGDKADAWDVDVSDIVTPGQESTFGFELQPYENWCRPNNPDCVDATGCTCDGHAYYKLEAQVIFYREPSLATTPEGALVPGKLHLVGNDPNPFNPSTTIKYHLAEPGPVVITVYDAQGNLVRTVDFDHSAGGAYAWTWNGRGPAGQVMPSGVYLYEVRYGQERVTAKMLLLK
jgi:hypothetical protein